NALVAHDIDPLPDQIATLLSGTELTSWIVDEPGIEQRNAVIACLPEKMLVERAAMRRVLKTTEEKWKIRKPRPSKRDPAMGALSPRL
ncbi:MAG: class I SAM-dependent methyltransferase, partial [Bradyrhizobium sp.]|nr:class I SAM-dependent methyltransferase [Bradyrhizobium sp.]